MKLKPAMMFQEHMVLQQGKTIPVWGTGANNDEITADDIMGKSEIQQSNSSQNQHSIAKIAHTNSILLYLNILTLFSLILLYIFHFSGIGTHSKHNPNATSPVVVSKEGLKIAYIDSDSILAHYQYAKDMEADLLKYKNAKEKSYTQQMNQFQTQLSNSKMSYTQAIINYKVQLLNIKILTLYDFEKDEPVVPITYEQNNKKK